MKITDSETTKIANMYPVNREKLAAAAPELLSLLNEAKYMIGSMALELPVGKGDSEREEELIKKIGQTISKVYEK